LADLNWRRRNDERLMKERGTQRPEPKDRKPKPGPWVPLEPPAGHIRCPAGCGYDIPDEQFAAHLRVCAFGTYTAATPPTQPSQVTAAKRPKPERLKTMCPRCRASLNAMRMSQHMRLCPGPPKSRGQ
jgi:hypothetical protein